MPLQLVEVPTETPGSCVFCSAGSTQGPFITDPMIDINWGDTLYICKQCAGIICDLHGRVTREEHEEVVKAHGKTLEDFHKLEAELEELRPLVERIKDGGKAARQLKKRAA